MYGLQQSGRADSRLSLQVRRARVGDEKAAIHGKHGRYSDAAPCIEVGNAQASGFAKSWPFPDTGLSS